MHHLLEIWFSWVLTGGYVGIIVLMAMGSYAVAGACRSRAFHRRRSWLRKASSTLPA